MDSPKINIYQKTHVWLNKRISLLLVRREKNKDYKALERFIFEFFLDGFIISLASIYFIPFSLLNIISFGAISFLIKRIFPSIITLFNSINLIKVGK